MLTPSVPDTGKPKPIQKVKGVEVLPFGELEGKGGKYNPFRSLPAHGMKQKGRPEPIQENKGI